jgi:hypothetical protein
VSVKDSVYSYQPPGVMLAPVLHGYSRAGWLTTTPCRGDAEWVWRILHGSVVQSGFAGFCRVMRSGMWSNLATMSC